MQKDTDLQCQTGKYERHDLEAVCRDALKQMIDKRYTEYFEQQGVGKILKYGIACRVKECKVMLEEN